MVVRQFDYTLKTFQPKSLIVMKINVAPAFVLLKINCSDAGFQRFYHEKTGKIMVSERDSPIKDVTKPNLTFAPCKF